MDSKKEQQRSELHRTIWGIANDLRGAVDSSIQLKSKKELIAAFLHRVNVENPDDIDRSWKEFVSEEFEADFTDIVKTEHLKEQPAREFIESAFEHGELKTTGTVVDKFMPPVSRFGGARTGKKEGIITKLKGFFERYIDIWGT